MRSSTLDTLTDEQKDQLYDWLLQMPVPQVAYKLAQPAPEGFGVKTYVTTLQRFKKSRWTEEAADQLEAAKTARATSADDAALDTAIASTLKRHLFERASAPDATTADLALLARFVHRNEKLKLEVDRVQISRERISQNNRRLGILERDTQVREQTLALRREESARRANSPSKTKHSESTEQSDHLGPYATNWDEVGDRTCKHFGITREELIRRAELRRTWKNPNDHPGTPASAPHPQPDADHPAPAPSSCAAPAHEESSFPTSTGVITSLSPALSSCAEALIPSNHECSSKQQPAPSREIPIETNNPPAPCSNPAPAVAALAARNEQHFKAIGAQAAAILNALNARTTHSKPENETNH